MSTVSIKKERVLYADILRIVAVFTVITRHISTNSWHGSYVTDSDWAVVNLFVATIRWEIPLLFMLSGMNFLDPERHITNKKLFTQYIPHLLVALFFWVVAYKTFAVSYNYITDSKDASFMDILNIIPAFFWGETQFHLWFLYDLVGLYLLVPILRLITQYAQRKLLNYLFLLYIVFAFVMPSIADLTGLGFKFGIPDMVGYTGYFFAGYYFSKYDISKPVRITLYVLGIASIIGGYALSTYHSYLSGYSTETFLFKNQSITNAISAVAVFVFFRYNIGNNPFKNWKYSTKINKNIIKISTYCFGTYLLHMFFFTIFTTFGYSGTTYSAIIAIPVLSLLVFALSFFTAMLIRKIPVLGKWII